MKKTRNILLFLTLVILLAGIASAGEVSEDTTGTLDTSDMKAVDDIQEVSQTNAVTDEKSLDNKIQSIAENNKTLDKNVNRDTKEATASDWNSLSSAVNAAKQASTDTTITLQNGYYDSTSTIAWMNNQNIVLTIDGNGQTINGNGQKVFYIQSGCSIVLKNIIIKNAHADYGTILNEGSLTVINSTFENNVAESGGAIHNVGTLKITDSIFNNNNANAGGAIHNYLGTVTITDSTFQNNVANTGGTINNGGPLTITNCIIQNNRANDDGGVIYSWETVTITNSTLKDNHATRGGAILNWGTLNVTDSTLENNDATSGGAAYNGGFLTLTDSTVQNNKANNGGAIYNNEGTLIINNNTFNNNNATEFGAAVYNNGTLDVINSILQDNNAQASGGAIYNLVNLTVTDSILENNKALDENAAKGGGAIFNQNGAKADVIRSTLRGNSANQEGGAINNFATITVTDSIMENNYARLGGAILNYAGTVAFTNCTLENNNALAGGAIRNYAGPFTLTNSTLRNNTAENGAAINNLAGYDSFIGNVFVDNHSDDKQTIILDYENRGEFSGNTYAYTDIRLSQIQLSIDDNKDTFNYGEDVTLNYYLQPARSDYYKDFNEGISDITVYVNDKKTITTKYEPTTLSNLRPGEYSVYFTSCNQQSNTVTFTVVGKIDVNITCDPIADVAYRDNVTITGKFMEENGRAISNSNVNVYINGKQYKARTDKKGAFTLAAPVKALGVNNVTLSYGGNTIYNSYEVNTTFNAGKQDLIITCDPIADVVYGDNVTITGLFTDKNGKEMINSNVNVYINAKQYKARTDSTGAFTLTAPVKAGGINNVTLSYGGNDYFNSYETSTTFNAAKQDLIITINKINNTAYADNVTITGEFTDKNGKAITNSNVNVYINGKQYKARTDTTGKYELTAPVKAIGENNVTVSYGGNNNYNSYSANNTFTATKQDIIITYDKISNVKKGKNVTITGKFTDKNGKAISNSNVNVYINGKQYKARTDSTGKYTLSTIANTVGTNNVTLSYGGNAYYNSYETSTTFKVSA